jgi:hypothetical protein
MTQEEADALLVNIIEALNVNAEWTPRASEAMNEIEAALKRVVKKHGKPDKAAARGNSGGRPENPG